MEEVYAEQIEINAPELLYVGDSQKLKVEFTPYNVSFKDVSWDVSDIEALSLTQEGTCTALSYGTVQVTATNADRSCTDTKTIKVYDHTTGVNISKNALKLTVGEKATLIANTLPIGTSDEMITWSTNDELVATVDDKGKIRGIGRGTCTINATSVDGGYTATCEVTVTQPVEALALEKHSLTLKIGETERLYAQIAPLLAGNKKVNWSSADEEVASVDSMGTVKALAAGETWIMAVSDDNPEAKDSCQIVVPDIPAPAPNGDCATPTIMVSGNKMTFECETPDAEFTSYLTTSEEFSGGEVVIENKDITFTLTVYAIAPGYDRSKPATMKFTVKKCDVNGDGHIDVADIATIISEMAARARLQEALEE
ncbi:MAG: Ig domain-containing protein [Prevotella sp.]|nr:Ig domain-containing protein [Prevotella sp.]